MVKRHEQKWLQDVKKMIKTTRKIVKTPEGKCLKYVKKNIKKRFKNG